jgi:hypothetical protein
MIFNPSYKEPAEVKENTTPLETILASTGDSMLSKWE